MPLFLQDGRVADLILFVMLVELVCLVAWRRWPLVEALLRLLPGALMVIALRAALTGAGWWWIATALALSFPVHLADLAQRRSTAAGPGARIRSSSSNTRSRRRASADR